MLHTEEPNVLEESIMKWCLDSSVITVMGLPNGFGNDGLIPVSYTPFKSYLYFLVKLDREVSAHHRQYFKSVGVPIVVDEIDDNPNWLVVGLESSKELNYITNLQHVMEIQEVTLEATWSR